MRSKKRSSKIRFLIMACVAALCLVLTISVVVIGLPNKAEAPTKDSSIGNNHSNNLPKEQARAFDKSRYSIDTPGSIWWIVNKERPLPAGYVPADLVVPTVTLRLPASNEQMKVSKTIAADLQNLFAAAGTAGHPLTFASGYRSESYQRQLYQTYVARDGQAAADRYSARPGTSEHQTGLSFDVCSSGTSCDLTQAFGNTPAGQWIAENAYQYGFIIHYAQGKEASTGYDYEPWHLRYVGTDLAAELKRTNQTLEGFFSL